jgi:hypothetical protein
MRDRLSPLPSGATQASALSSREAGFSGKTSETETAMSGDQPPAEREPPEPPRLRALRLLVTVLTATMILGLIVIVGLVVITLTRSRPAVALPEGYALPAGENLHAFTMGEGWVAVVTEDRSGVERIRVLEATTGKQMHVVTIGELP